MDINRTNAPFAPLIDIADYAMGAAFIFMTSYANTLAALNASLQGGKQDAAAPGTESKQ